jgi:hypothetical protein
VPGRWVPSQEKTPKAPTHNLPDSFERVTAMTAAFTCSFLWPAGQPRSTVVRYSFPAMNFWTALGTFTLLSAIARKALRVLARMLSGCLSGNSCGRSRLACG